MRAILLFALCAACFSVSAQATKEEAYILNLSNRKFNWLIAKQTDSIAWLSDERIQFIHSNGWVQNKQDLVDDLKSGKLDYRKIAVKSAAVRLYPATKPTTAVLTGSGTFEGITEGKPFSIDLRYTEVYIKDSGKIWRLVSRHANRMP